MADTVELIELSFSFAIFLCSKPNSSACVTATATGAVASVFVGESVLFTVGLLSGLPATVLS